MVFVDRLFLIILLNKYVISTNWKIRAKQEVRVSKIISTEKDISLISCQVKCNVNQDCYEIGTDENVDLGKTGGCYLLRRNDQSDSSKTIANPSIVTKEMYVYHKHDLCKASRCRSDQTCEVTGARYTCVCKNGINDSKFPLSCDTIKKSQPMTPSGIYTINPSKPVSVYCDMDIDTNGWMLIANITLPNPIKNEEARKLSSIQSLSNDIGQLDQVSNGRFRFNPVRLADFDASFRYLHFYCKKPGGNTISISTITKNVLDFFMLKNDFRPAACNSFKRLPEDTSRLSTNCSRWGQRSQRWGGLSSNENRLYNFPFYIHGNYHYGIKGARYECDDKGGTNAGVWRIFVR